MHFSINAHCKNQCKVDFSKCSALFNEALRYSFVLMTHLKCKRLAVQYYKNSPRCPLSFRNAVEKFTAILISGLLYMTFKTSLKGSGPLFLIYWSCTMLAFGVGLFHSLYWHFRALSIWRLISYNFLGWFLW